MNALGNLHTLFRRQLSDLYSAETQLSDVLPQLRRQASNRHLKEILSDHIRENSEHQTRIRDIAQSLDIDLSGDTCEAMKGLTKKAKNLRPGDSKMVRDATLIADAKRIEQYEISTCDTALQLAKSWNHQAAIEDLQQIRDKKKQMEQALSDVIRKNLNRKAKKKED